MFEGKVHYKIMDLSFENRDNFEAFFPDRSVVRIENTPIFYVTYSDRRKLWPVDPHQMEQNGYTYKAKILAPPLLFGGYGVSKVIGVQRVDGEAANVTK